MAISFVSNALGATTTTTSFSITLPATRVGDVIILEYTHRATTDATIGGTYTGPAFTEKHDQLYDTSARSGKTLWSRATGNHDTQTVTGSGLTNSCAAIITIYRGVKDSGDPLADATIVGEQNAAANETQAEITTATNGAWVVLVVANSPDVAVTAQTCTSPGSLSGRAEVLSTGGLDTSIAHASASKATAGATGAFTWSQTDGASGSWAYAIIPAPETLPYVSKTSDAAPQHSDAPEYAGCASLFMACGALFASVGTDTVGAAEYQVGSHQEAIANSQPQPQVWGYTPPAAPAADVPSHTLVVCGEQVFYGDAVVWGPTPRTADPVQRGTIGAAPEQVNSGDASVYGPTPSPLAADVFTKAVVAAPEQVNSGDAWLYGPTPRTADDVPQRTQVAAQEHVDSSSAVIWRQPPASVAANADAIGAASYTVGTHGEAYANSNGYALKWGKRVVEFVSGTDVRVGQTWTAAPEQVQSGAASLWGLTPPDVWVVSKWYEVDQESTDQPGSAIWGFTPPAVAGTDPPPPKTQVAAPEHVDSSSASVWGPFKAQDEKIGQTAVAAPEQVASGDAWRARFVYPFVAGSDTPIGQTRVAAPEQINSGDAQFFAQPPPSASTVIPKTRIAAPEQVNSGDASVWGLFEVQRDQKIASTILATPQSAEGYAITWTAYPTVDAPISGLKKLYRKYRGYDTRVPRGERNPRNRR